MTSNIQTGKRSFGRRILWIIKTVFVSLLLIVILGGLAWAAFSGTTELKRSFDSITVRVDANKQRIALLNDEVAQFKADDLIGKINQLQTNADDLDAQLAALQEQTAADLTRQSDLLTALQEDVAAAASSSETAVTDTAQLGDAFLALQQDINESNSQIDALGGEFDSLRSETDRLQTDLAATAVAGSDFASLQQTLALFQAWEQITRARLHLSENNVGLAANDVEQTIRLMELLVAASAEEDATALELVQARLALAFNSLPDDPETAVRDLENAWSQLDAILTARLYPDAILETPLAEPAAADTTTEEPTATPEATQTPSS